MNPINIAGLINLVGYTLGIALYAMLLGVANKLQAALLGHQRLGLDHDQRQQHKRTGPQPRRRPTRALL